MDKVSEKYKHLLGKEVKIEVEGIEYDGIVVGVHEDFGITIVNANDETDKLYCLNKERSSHYDEKFPWAVRCIENGEIRQDKDVYSNHSPFMTSCAFE